MEDKRALVSVLVEAKGSPMLYTLLKRKALRQYRTADKKRIAAWREKTNAG